VWTKRIISEAELAPYTHPGVDRTLASQVNALYEQQKHVWPRFRQAHDGLMKAKVRRVELGGVWVLCQYTPHRMASVSAQVDPAAIRSRLCFLCPERLDPEERGLSYGDEYLILCNVSPIFDLHLVISHRDHVPQQIGDHFDATLRLIRALSPHFNLIYNGPRCGASAPDHLHFQAFPSRNLPLEAQLGDHPPGIGGVLVERAGILVAAPTGFHRHFIVFQGQDPVLLSSWFRRALEVLAEPEATAEEPMINLMMTYRDGRWQVVLFPRDKHRPRCYSDQGSDRILISPGAIDMAGLFVIPREKDYDTVDAELLRDIYGEVTLADDRFSQLVEALRVGL
jgi:hypothetical protein